VTQGRIPMTSIQAPQNAMQRTTVRLPATRRWKRAAPAAEGRLTSVWAVRASGFCILVSSQGGSPEHVPPSIEGALRNTTAYTAPSVPGALVSWCQHHPLPPPTGSEKGAQRGFTLMGRDLGAPATSSLCVACTTSSPVLYAMGDLSVCCCEVMCSCRVLLMQSFMAIARATSDPRMSAI